MTNSVTFEDVLTLDGLMTTYAVIDVGNGGFISMTKVEYDAQQLQLATPTL